MPDAAARADVADDGQHDIFSGYAWLQLSLNSDRHPFRPALRQCLSGEHVLYFACSDAEGEGAERAVCCGVAVAADDRSSGKCSALFRANDMYDTLPFVAHRIINDAKFVGVDAKCFNLFCRNWVSDRLIDVFRRHVVVFGRNGEFGPANGAATHSKTVEGLWACDLMNEVEVDI